jgi:hypothetical protein
LGAADRHEVIKYNHFIHERDYVKHFHQFYYSDFLSDQIARLLLDRRDIPYVLYEAWTGNI